jgi:uncharacterized membrane protein
MTVSGPFLAALRAVHIAAGAAALSTFAIPLLSRKGGRLHRAAGKAYVAAMAVVSLSAFLSCGFRLAAGAPDPTLPLFLGFLAILAANAAWTGLRALRFKTRTEPHRHPVDLAFPALVLLLSAAMLPYGLRRGAGVLVGFSAVGFFASIRALRYWLGRPSTERHAMYQHMQSMVGSCIATVSAFLVVNARSFGVSDRWMPLAWLGPTLVGLPGVLFWVARLKREERSRKEPLTENAA